MSDGTESVSKQSSAPNKRALGYVAAAGMYWFIGFMFMTGWNTATLGTPNFGAGIAYAFGFVVLGFLILGFLRMFKVATHGIESWVPFGLGIISAFGAITIGFASGGVWSGIGGAYPDRSGYGNMQSRASTGHPTTTQPPTSQ